MRKVLILLLGIILLTACSDSDAEAQTAEVQGKEIAYEQLLEMIEEADQELSSLEEEIENKNKDLQEVENSLSENQSKFEGLEELAENRDQVNQEVNDAESELESLKSEISDKKDEIETIQGEIVKAKDEPIKLNAGYYYFGIDDIEPGRYKITAQEGNRGNVFIRDERGSYVAETFGDGERNSLTEFTFQSNEGDEIEATIPINLYPVE